MYKMEKAPSLQFIYASQIPSSSSPSSTAPTLLNPVRRHTPDSSSHLTYTSIGFWGAARRAARRVARRVARGAEDPEMEQPDLATIAAGQATFS